MPSPPPSSDPASLSPEELSVSECWALLRSIPIGRIALAGTNGIEVFPVNHLVDGGTIIFRSGLGTKLRLVGDGVACTFEADEIDAIDGVVWSVVVRGVARPVSAHDEILETLDLEVPTWHAGPKPVYVRVTVSSVSGRRFPVAQR